VTGSLGAAALGLKLELHPEQISGLAKPHQEQALAALHRPQPCIKAGLIIQKYSTCAIDISDGLYADLGHILEQSQCGAIVDVEKIPLAECLQDISKDDAYKMALTGGDDYQLCFTLSESAMQELLKQNSDLDFSIIGRITAARSLILRENNEPYRGLKNKKSGYDHFR